MRISCEFSWLFFVRGPWQLWWKTTTGGTAARGINSRGRALRPVICSAMGSHHFSKKIYTWTIFHSYKRLYDTNLYLLVLGIMEKIVPSLEDLALLPRWKHGEGASYWPWVKRLTIDAYGVRLPMVNISTDNWSNWTGIEPGDGGRGQCSPTGCT
jgi:hypothetical protein